MKSISILALVVLTGCGGKIEVSTKSTAPDAANALGLIVRYGPDEYGVVCYRWSQISCV